MSPSLRVVLVSVDGRQTRAQWPSDMITVYIFTLTGASYILDVYPSDPISQIFDYYTNRTGTPREMTRLVFGGKDLEDDKTVHESGVTNGARITVILRLRGGKPVIYLYPPTVMDVSVKLSLISAWEYSAVYPLTAIKTIELAKGQEGQQIEWHVHANPSGLLRDKPSGKDITYLFWEAECVSRLPTPLRLMARF